MKHLWLLWAILPSNDSGTMIVYPSGSQTFLHVDPQLKYTIFCSPVAQPNSY